METLLLLCVISWYSVLGSSSHELTFKIGENNSNSRIENVTVNPGSNITVSCIIPPMAQRKIVSWYKVGLKNNVAGLSYENEKCIFQGTSYWQRVHTECNGNTFSIVYIDVDTSMTGIWYCSGQVTDATRKSQKISLKVEVHTDSSPVPIIPTTTPSTKHTSTFSQSILRSTTTTATGGVKFDTSRHSQNNVMIVILGGSIGGAVFVLVIITVVIVSLQARKISQTGDKRSVEQAGDGNGRPGEDQDFQAFDDDMGGQYAQIGDKRVLAAKVVAENTLYVSYNKEEEKSPGTGASAFDVGADVYSVVQKPSKSQDQSSNPDGNPVPQSSGYDEVGDLYSVVQKPAKN